MDLQAIRAIFFDFDGTLRHNEPAALDSFYRIAAEEGFSTSPEQRLQGERWVNEYWAESAELQQDVARFGPWQDNGDFWANHARRHLSAIGSPEAQAWELASIVTQRMRQEYEPVDCVQADLPHVLNNLRNAGLLLAVVSNRSHPYDELIVSLGLAPFFEFWIAAGELRVFKPNPGIFQHAAERAGVSAEQVVYVGDNYYADVSFIRHSFTPNSKFMALAPGYRSLIQAEPIHRLQAQSHKAA